MDELSFDTSPLDALEVARKRVETKGANHLMVIWEPEEGGREIVHSQCTIATAVYLLDRAKNDIYDEDEEVAPSPVSAGSTPGLTSVPFERI